MKGKLITQFCLVLLFLVRLNVLSQPIIDLSVSSQKEEKITLSTKKIKIINRLPTSQYKILYVVEKTPGLDVLVPPFDFAKLSGTSNDCNCNPDINKKIDDLFNV